MGTGTESEASQHICYNRGFRMLAPGSFFKDVVNCQKTIVPVGRPRPYSIIILNMRVILKASLRASS